MDTIIRSFVKSYNLPHICNQIFSLVVSDCDLGSDHFESSSPGLSVVVQAEGVLPHTKTSSDNDLHHLVNQPENYRLSNHLQLSQSTHHSNDDTIQEPQENSTNLISLN